MRTSVFTLTALLISLIVHAQAPTLGAAAPFTIFSSTGAVGNTGTNSKFTGNIGTLSGAITIGVNVNGTLYNANAVTIAAAAAIGSAYQQLELTPPTDTQLALTSYTLGKQDTLHALVDSINVNTVLNDTLVLDGQNNANAVFIFKINGTFSTTSQATVLLINGALACNVFWEIKGALTTAVNTQLRGTFIVNSAAAGLASGTILEGRILTYTAGAITMNNVLTYLPTGCGSTVLTGPAAPNLGTVACYTLFTTNGANTNSGTTYLAGDVGTNVGLTTGYNPLLITGALHAVPDPSTAYAASDLTIAYNALNGLSTDIELLYPALFGNSLVLTPHTYLLNAATALTDTLFLNAAGNPNAVFVIKINGAFTTSTYATVALMNGAQAKNVYWKVEGATSMNDYSTMKGTFISNNGAMNLNIGVYLEGRGLSTTGALSAVSDSVVIPPLVCPIAALPLTWLSLRCIPNTSTVSLFWSVSNQFSGAAFIVEKSSDSRSFENLIDIPVRYEPTQSEHAYQATDPSPFKQNFYRIAYTDNAGIKTYSKIISAMVDGSTLSKLYSDGSDYYYATNKAEPGLSTLEVYDQQGRKVSSQSLTGSTCKILHPQSPGLYLVYVRTGNEKVFVSKLVYL